MTQYFKNNISAKIVDKLMIKPTEKEVSAYQIKKNMLATKTSDRTENVCPNQEFKNVSPLITKRKVYKQEAIQSELEHSSQNQETSADNSPSSLRTDV